MVKKNNLILLIVFAILIIIFVIYINLSNIDKTKMILNQDGYVLSEITKPEIIEVFIKPEWIDTKPNNKANLNIRLMEKKNTVIYLESVHNRVNDIYFSFSIKNKMIEDSGTFLSNILFNADKTNTTYFPKDAFKLTTNNGEKIEIGQISFGPDFGFSFGINKNDSELLVKGFNLKYSGLILYQYSKDDKSK